MSAASFTATFPGGDNQGFQLGQNTGSITVTQAAPILIHRPTPSSTVPFRRDPDYVHRDVYDELWRRSREPASRVVLWGLGGVGKSQLAITYAHRTREERPTCWVFWVHASNATRFKEGYKRIAECVQITGCQELNADILGLVFTWLCNENNEHWVMILDNADNAAVIFDPNIGSTSSAGQRDRSLSEYIPQVSHGSVVITSRSRDVASRLTGRMEDILYVPPMDNNASVALLGKKLRIDAGNEDVTRLVSNLDGMPLAITQAAAYIGRRAPRMTVSKYLQELSRSDRDRTRLLQLDVGDPRRDGLASNSIIITWHVSFVHIRQEQSSAARLLALMSLFDREGIPASLLKGYAQDEEEGEEGEEEEGGEEEEEEGEGEGEEEEEEEEEEKEKEEQAGFEDDIAMLRSYCLVGEGEKYDTFEMHRLVQFSTKKWLEQQGELQRWQERYINKMCEAFPAGAYENWVQCEGLFPHAEAAMSYRPRTTECLTQWAIMLYNASWYARKSGRYSQAEVMARECVATQEKVLGREHPNTLTSVSALALVLDNQGQYSAAEEMNRRALKGYEKVLGREHPDTLISVSNLALVLDSKGQYSVAEELSRRALEGREKVLGREHSHTLMSVSNLALILKHRGQYSAAEEMDRRALNGREKMLGREHPDTLTIVNNLALVLQDQGQYSAAEELSRRALEGREKVLGREHPHTLISVSNLALVLKHRGQYSAAEEMNRRTLKGREKMLGQEHPDTLASVSNLALVLQDQGQYSAAEEMYRRGLKGSEKVMGREHPGTLITVANLGLMLHYQGQYSAAEEMHLRALEGREKVLGPEHPNTLDSVSYLAYLLQATGQFDEALVMYERACTGFQKKLGGDHPTTGTCEANLASVLKLRQNGSANAPEGSDSDVIEHDKKRQRL